jgi:hypothetical protein
MKCHCETPPFNYQNYTELYGGYDKKHGHISVSECKKCKTRWLKYLIEEEWQTSSGRWWRVKLDTSSISIEIEDARQFIEQQTEGFFGGSFFGHAGKALKGKIRIQ